MMKTRKRVCQGLIVLSALSATLMGLARADEIPTVDATDQPAPPRIRTAIVPGFGERPDCLVHVRKAAELAGFGPLEIDIDDAEGPNGSYKTETICMEKDVIVIVAGPSNQQARELRDQITDYIERIASEE